MYAPFFSRFSNVFKFRFFPSITQLFKFHSFCLQKSESCTNMDQSELPVYKLTEKYFTNTMVVQLKAYVMIQLSYLTRAAKVRFRDLFTYDTKI